MFRYSVGNSVWVFETSPLNACNFAEVLDSVECLEITEHKKVRGYWDPKGSEMLYDGYLAESESGMKYTNQYPLASFGQTSDAANYIFQQADFPFKRKIDAIYWADHLVQYPSMAAQYNMLIEALRKKGLTLRLGALKIRQLDGSEEEIPEIRVHYVVAD